MKEYQAELFVPIKTKLGEGILWDSASRSALWLDLNLGLFFEHQADSGETIVFTNREDVITTLALWDERCVLVSGRRDLYLFDRDTREREHWLHVPGIPNDYRFNDGKFDPAGRLIIGTAFQGEGLGDGKLYKITRDKVITELINGGITCSNGLCWTKDCKTMYYIDTPTKKVMVYDYDIATGDIANGRMAVDTSLYLGIPDGMTIDESGNIWVAMFGGFSVLCFNPATAELIAKVNVPVERVTCCAFGEDHKLLITTARGCLYSAVIS